MTNFLRFHPGSSLSASLHHNSSDLIDLLLRKPSKCFDILKAKYNFGSSSDFWDDHIFNVVIRPVLEHILQQHFDVNRAINLYSDIDHLLFLTYVRRDEDPVRFRRAFWNINYYGKLLSSKFVDKHKILLSNKPTNTNMRSIKKIAFIFGPFSLSHAEFFEAF